MKYTFKQFQIQFPDDDACLDAVLARRYGNTEHCPNCGVESKLTRIQGRRAYACKEGCHVYPCVGTPFEHSSTPLTLWFHAMYLLTATRNGVSAKELQRQLGVTYKCAWRIGHQLRGLMAARAASQNPEPMTGHVEIDETYVGGKARLRGKSELRKRWSGPHLENKTVVMGFVQRSGPFRGFVLPDAKKHHLIPRIIRTVAKGTMINTDTLSAYKGLSKLGYQHESLNHTAEEWARGIHNTNRIEGFWSHLKRGLSSTHSSVSKQHMQNYVDEFTFRYNHRKEPAEMFQRLLAQISTRQS